MCFFSGLDVRLGPVCVFFYRVCYNTSIARSQLSARCVYFSLCRASMDTCFASQISPFFFSAVLLFSRFGFPAPVSFNVLHREQPRKVKKKKKTRERKKKKKGWSVCASLHCLLHFHFFLCCCCERACRAFCVTLANVKLHRGSSASRRRRVSVQCKWQTSSIIGETEVCEGTLFVVVVDI